MGCKGHQALHAGGRGCGEESGVTTVRASTEWPQVLPGMGHSQSSNWEITQQVKKSGRVWPPPVLKQAMQGPLWCFVQWKIHPLLVFVMCPISQPVAQQICQLRFYRPCRERSRAS